MTLLIYVYIWFDMMISTRFYGDTPSGVWYLSSYGPPMDDLCRGCIVGRFSPYEEASVEVVEGGDYELTRGKVTWDATALSRGLLRLTLVSDRDIYMWFFYFCIKTLYVLCFHMYMYYKRTLVVSDFALVRRCLEKVFKPAQNILIVIIHELFFNL